MFDRRSYLKQPCDQVISSLYERVNSNTTHIMQLSRCVEKSILLLIVLVPFTPSFTVIRKQIRVRVRSYVIVVGWNLQTRIRKKVLFVSS